MQEFHFVNVKVLPLILKQEFTPNDSSLCTWQHAVFMKLFYKYPQWFQAGSNLIEMYSTIYMLNHPSEGHVFPPHCVSVSSW